MLDIIRENHTNSNGNNITVPINCVHVQNTLINIVPIKPKTTIQLADIGSKVSNGTLIKLYYYYIYGSQHYPPPEINNYWSISIYSLHSAYRTTPPPTYLYYDPYALQLNTIYPY